MSEPEIGKVKAIAVRTAPNGPMREISEATSVVDGGLDGDLTVNPDRGITFLSNEQWAMTMKELGADLPWYTRRANVLVECASLGHLIGKTICVGSVHVDIKDETDPCRLMDQQHSGLREALVPEMRGGVLGRVVQGGSFKIGDMVTVVEVMTNA